MRFKKGSKLELLDKREMSAGSWCCMEIVSGNGHYYIGKYDCYSDVPGPLVTSPICWVPGDILEFYEKNSRKVAEISMVIGGSYSLVCLLVSSRKLRAHTSSLRM